MDKRLQNKNERAINKRNVDLIIAREEAKIKKRQMKERTGNPKIDGPLEDFEKVYGYKIGSKFDEKINAMKDGGVATPKKKPKNFTKTVEKQKRDKAIASGQLNIGDFNEMTPSMMEDFYKDASKVKKMKFGGKAVPSKFKGFSKLPEGVQQKIDPKLASKYEVGGEATPIKNKTKAQKQMDDYKKRTADSLAKTEKGRELVKMGISSGFGSDLSEFTKKKKAERISNKMKKKIPVKKMKMGGKVEEYGAGGNVKGGKMSCRGMGAAIKGGGFSIR